MLIREWEIKDIAEVAAIEKASFSDPWNTDMILSSFNLPIFTGLIAEENGKVVGYIGATHVFEDGEILLVAVEKTHRKKGVATALLTQLSKTFAKCGVDKLFLEVRKKNSAARACYAAFGFVEIGERVGYYGDDDAVLMEKTL